MMLIGLNRDTWGIFSGTFWWIGSGKVVRFSKWNSILIPSEYYHTYQYILSPESYRWMEKARRDIKRRTNLGKPRQRYGRGKRCCLGERCNKATIQRTTKEQVRLVAIQAVESNTKNLLMHRCASKCLHLSSAKCQQCSNICRVLQRFKHGYQMHQVIVGGITYPSFDWYSVVYNLVRLLLVDFRAGDNYIPSWKA